MPCSRHWWLPRPLPCWKGTNCMSAWTLPNPQDKSSELSVHWVLANCTCTDVQEELRGQLPSFLKQPLSDNAAPGCEAQNCGNLWVVPTSGRRWPKGKTENNELLNSITWELLTSALPILEITHFLTIESYWGWIFVLLAVDSVPIVGVRTNGDWTGVLLLREYPHELSPWLVCAVFCFWRW